KFLQLQEENDAQEPAEVLREKLGATRVALAEMFIKDGQASKAEHELSQALATASGQRRVAALKLRARARRVLGNEAGAHKDEIDAGVIPSPVPSPAKTSGG